VLPDKMDKSIEKEFWNVWDKHRSKATIDLEKEQGRPKRRDEL